jgi:hypothetical protein
MQVAQDKQLMTQISARQEQLSSSFSMFHNFFITCSKYVELKNISKKAAENKNPCGAIPQGFAWERSSVS